MAIRFAGVAFENVTRASVPSPFDVQRERRTERRSGSHSSDIFATRGSRELSVRRILPRIATPFLASRQRSLSFEDIYISFSLDASITAVANSNAIRPGIYLPSRQTPREREREIPFPPSLLLLLLPLLRRRGCEELKESVPPPPSKVCSEFYCRRAGDLCARGAGRTF